MNATKESENAGASDVISRQELIGLGVSPTRIRKHLTPVDYRGPEGSGRFAIEDASRLARMSPNELRQRLAAYHENGPTPEVAARLAERAKARAKNRAMANRLRRIHEHLGDDDFITWLKDRG